MSDFDATQLDSPRLESRKNLTRSIGARRLLALLPVVGLSLAASGCLVSPSYGVRSSYGDPYYAARGSSYGVRPYYSSQRTVIVQPRHRIVRQPSYHHHRIDRAVRSDHRHRGYRADRGHRIHRAVRPASRPHRQVHPHAVRNAPRHLDREDSRRHGSRPSVRGHDRHHSEARSADRRPDRRQVRDRERRRDGERTRTDERRRQQQGRGRN